MDSPVIVMFMFKLNTNQLPSTSFHYKSFPESRRTLLAHFYQEIHKQALT